MRLAGLALVLAASAAACAKGTPATTPEPAAPAQAPTSTWEPPPLPTEGPIAMVGPLAPDKPWDSMSYSEKEWYMVGKVHPVMRQVFQTFDHDKYEGEKFECAPCHGDDAAAKKYKMPSDHLSAIPAPGTEDWKAMENAKVVKFMVQRVTPVMAQLLGEAPYDPATGQGYTCWGCHPKQ